MCGTRLGTPSSTGAEKKASGSTCRIGACGRVASWAVWTLRQKPRNVEIAGGGPAARPGHRCRQDRGPEIPQYETVTIDMPSKGRARDVAERPIVLRRGRLLPAFRLPIGSAEGKYKFHIVDKSGKVQNTVEPTATTEEHVTRLRLRWTHAACHPVITNSTGLWLALALPLANLGART